MFRKLDEIHLKQYWYELKGSELFSKKFCICFLKFLLVFRDKKDLEPKQVVLLNIDMSVRISESTVVAKDNKSKLYSFALISGNKERKFFVSNSDEYLRWIEKFNIAIGQ